MDETMGNGGAHPVILEAKDILKVLPHRYPFLLVDRILELEPGKRIVGLKNVTMNEPFFVGHFPGNPIMPGVLILEMLAQIGGVMLLTLDEHKGKLAYIAGVDEARFRKPIVPGDALVSEVTFIRSRGSIGSVKATARVNGKIVCDAKLLFALVASDGAEG